MASYLTTTAIVINRRKFLESDQSIILLTPELGKITTVAKGITSPKSRRQGHLEPGNIIKAQLYQKQDRYWLTETSVTEHVLSSARSLTQLNLIFYFLEIINQSVAENQQIDGIYQVTRSIINAVDQNQFVSLLQQEINLLDLLGFGVPTEITDFYQDKKYPECQNRIRLFLESIMEKPLKSSRLFR